jgi:hypothetical protein
MLALLDPLDPRVEPVWRALEANAQPTFFLSWGWIENWLACLPRETRPRLAMVLEDGRPAAAFFLGRRRIRRRFVASDALFVNTTGLGELAIEHNGILREPTSDCSLLSIVGMLPDDWDELHLPAIDQLAFPELPLLRAYRTVIDREVGAPYVDLETVRGVDGGYLSLVGGITRAQIRRSWHELGDLDLEIATDLPHAMDIWGELLRLHARRWHERGARGAFADPWVERFHRRLIHERLRHGEIQLLRVRACGHTIGCLYNFVYGGRVMFYQSGLEALPDPHVEPSFVCHAAAVAYNASAGHAVYDLLGDTARKTRGLATGENRLLWLRVQRKRARFAIEDRLRAWKHAFAGLRLLPSRT